MLCTTTSSLVLSSRVEHATIMSLAVDGRISETAGMDQAKAGGSSTSSYDGQYAAGSLANGTSSRHHASLETVSSSSMNGTAKVNGANGKMGEASLGATAAAAAASQVANGKEQQDDAGDDLWSSILNSVQSTRATSTKNVILLGEPRVGKSTLLSHLAAAAPAGYISHHSESADGWQASSSRAAGSAIARSESTQIAQQQASAMSASTADLGLGYSYFDVGDADGEDVIGRVGVYQVSSSDPANLSLLPFGLLSTTAETSPDAEKNSQSSAYSINSRTPKSSNGSMAKVQVDSNPQPSIDALRDALFIIVLDWEAPWTFLSQLVQWLDVIQETIDKAAQRQEKGGQQASWTGQRAELDSLKEGIEQYIRTYSEPAGASAAEPIQIDGEDVGDISTASAVVAVSNPNGVDASDSSPLPEGCLTHNFGVPIVVVCTKADMIDTLEKQRNFKEERFDYIQQVLRTVCLKYGAALFFTSHARPASFDVLREYVLHRLFAPSRQHSATGAFTFSHRASTIERDVLLVPSGWDSFGKIRALREGFDCVSMANGWEWDAAVERIRRTRGLPEGSAEAEEAAEEQIDRRNLITSTSADTGPIGSAIKLYEDIVEDWDASAPNIGTSQARVKLPDDQAFLLQHYEKLQREPESRGKMVRQTSSGNLSEQGTPTAARSGVVGPMGSSSLSLPSVERAMQERLADEGRSAKSSSRRTEGRDQHRADSGRSTPTLQNPLSPSLASGERPTTQSGAGQAIGSPSTGSAAAAAAAAAAATSSGGAQTPKQSEVLHSFFQSLLKDKAPSGSGSGGASRGSGARSDRR